MGLYKHLFTRWCHRVSMPSFEGIYLLLLLLSLLTYSIKSHCMRRLPSMVMGCLCHCKVVICILRERTGCKTAAMATPLLLTSGPARWKAMLHGCGTSPVCLVYGIATVFQLCPGDDMIYEIKMRNSKLILLSTQGLFNLP